MSRTKGSKNKKGRETEVVKEVKQAPKKQTSVELKEGVPPVAQPWKPGPDMGTIKAPPPALDQCKNCSHKREVHYGGDKEWCNIGGCNCLQWKQ